MRYDAGMATLQIDPVTTAEQTAFNLRTWERLCDDPELARIEGRIETDRFGRLIMTPPPGFSHGTFQNRIGSLLEEFLPHGIVATECPVSTPDGVRAADVAWISRAKLDRVGGGVCLPEAPEICVEVVSPRNTEAELTEKRRLYFAAGAEEVWLCRDGAMEFHTRDSAVPASAMCPEMPARVTI